MRVYPAVNLLANGGLWKKSRTKDNLCISPGESSSYLSTDKNPPILFYLTISGEFNIPDKLTLNITEEVVLY